jgi:hypothetical protein
MKLTSTIVLIFCIFTSVNAQSLTAEFYTGNQAANASQFPLYDGLLTASGETYQFGTTSGVTISNPVSFSVSDNLTMIGNIQNSNGLSAIIYNYKGEKLLNSEMEFISSSDETIGFTLLDNGEFIVRDNVANFSFFNAAGDRAYTYSNSSNASGGEQTSEIAVSDDGVMKVAYNPVIQYQNSRGSRISLITGDGQADQIFTSQDRVLIKLTVSSSDHAISAVSENGAGSRMIHWFDRFGNMLFEMEPGLEVKGFNVSDDSRFITIFSGNRVQVYQRESGERLGSASSRSTILHAAYFPESNLIVTFGGEAENQQVVNPEITAIDLQQRQIESTQLEETVMFMNRSRITIDRDGANTYRIGGINRPIQVTARF